MMVLEDKEEVFKETKTISIKTIILYISMEICSLALVYLPGKKMPWTKESAKEKVEAGE